MLVLAAASLSAGSAVCLLPWAPSDDAPWQRATGGIGLGPATAADWSFFTYDPRLESSCEAELGPIPGGPCYVPHHGASLADLPALDRR